MRGSSESPRSSGSTPRPTALNGGPHDKLNEAFSLVVGWLEDRFGLSWQVVPTLLGRVTTTGAGAAR
jgi:predicted 3-demethylubiquinone-9 3-methyltransferase (glyoxalase superfamily)